jgi:hypothetical protein
MEWKTQQTQQKKWNAPATMGKKRERGKKTAGPKQS